MNLSTETAVFALGNFWEPAYEFNKMHGVLHTEVGYTGGTSDSPTYHDVGDHAEAVQIEFDPHVLSYDQLLENFWKLHDPTTGHGSIFRSAIFYLDTLQRETAMASRLNAQTDIAQEILTEIIPAGKFYPAETYHQHYIAKLRGEM